MTKVANYNKGDSNKKNVNVKICVAKRWMTIKANVSVLFLIFFNLNQWANPHRANDKNGEREYIYFGRYHQKWMTKKANDSARWAKPNEAIDKIGKNTVKAICEKQKGKWQKRQTFHFLSKKSMSANQTERNKNNE